MKAIPLRPPGADAPTAWQCSACGRAFGEHRSLSSRTLRQQAEACCRCLDCGRPVEKDRPICDPCRAGRLLCPPR
jgi:hypothetical protein